MSGNPCTSTDAHDEKHFDAFLYIFRMFAPESDETALAAWLHGYADALASIDPLTETTWLYSRLGELLDDAALICFCRQFSPNTVAWKRFMSELEKWEGLHKLQFVAAAALTEAENRRFELAETARTDKLRRDVARRELADFSFDSDAPAFAGKTFVLTGDFIFNDGDRDALKPLIEAKGGRVTGGVSGKTDYLIIGGYGGYGRDKIKKVREQADKGKSIPVLHENELLTSLGYTAFDISGTPAYYGDFSLLALDNPREDVGVREFGAEQLPVGGAIETETADGLSELLGGLFGFVDGDGTADGAEQGEAEQKVMGVPEAGRRVVCADGLDVLAPGGAVYWWDEGLIHFARPAAVPAAYHDGLFSLPECFGRQWEWSVRTSDTVQSDFASAAAWSAAQKRNFEDDEFSVNPHWVDHAEETMYILTRGWSEASRPDAASYLSAPAVFLLYLYRGGLVYSLTGRYTCFDGERGLPPELLAMLKSLSPAQDAGIPAAESALKKYGNLAGGAGQIDAFELFKLFVNRELYFDSETDLAWNGKNHEVKGLSFHYRPANPDWEPEYSIEACLTIDGVRRVIGPDTKPPANAGALTAGALALCACLAATDGLVVPRERLHPNILEVLPSHDFTHVSLFALANQHSLIIMDGGGRREGRDAYTVPLDINVKNGVPAIHQLIGRFVGALRCFNGLSGPFDISFSNARNLDGEIVDIEGEPVAGAGGAGNITLSFEG